MKFLFLAFALLCSALAFTQTAEADPDNSVYLVTYVGGNAATINAETRNGLTAGVEAHVVLKQDTRFGVDFGAGIGYNSISLPGGKSQDFAVTASVGFTDCKYVSGGMLFTFDATDGVLSPSMYLALTYPVSPRLSLFGRTSLGMAVAPERDNYMVGRGQAGVAYYLFR